VELGDAAALSQLEELDWRAFERLVADLFDRLGYQAKCIGGKRDHGADVIAERGAERVAIQVKHRKERHWIGETAVRAVVTARPLYDCNRALVVTNSTFAPGVAAIAAVHDVELWDGDRLRDELLSFCVLCGRHVSPRVRAWCLEREDEFGGRVYCFDHQRRLTDVLRVSGRTSLRSARRRARA
jgi:restriction system protein